MAELNATDLRNLLRGIPTFNEQSGTSGSFRTHMRTYSLYAALNGLEHQRQKKIVLMYSLRGRSSDRAQHLLTAAGSNEVTYDEFVVMLRSIFQPESEALVARIEFNGRKQHPEEDAGSYFTTKRALYLDAYPEGGDFSVFFEALILGLASPVVKRLLRRSCPEGYDETRVRLLQITAAERSAVIGGYGEQVGLEGLRTVVSSTMNYADSAHNSGPTPMEVDNIRPRPAFQKSGSGSRPDGGKGGKTENRTCFRCGKKGHLKNACRVRLPAGKQGTDQRGGHNQKQHSNPRRQGQVAAVDGAAAPAAGASGDPDPGATDDEILRLLGVSSIHQLPSSVCFQHRA